MTSLCGLKDIPGYEGIYGVTKTGRVYSYPKKWIGTYGRTHHHKGKWLKRSNNSLTLIKDRRMESFNIFRAIACAWLPNPTKKRYVCHKDGNAQNNALSNLFWSEHATPLKKVAQYNMNGKYLRKFKSMMEASRALDICHSGISCCIRGGCRSAGGFMWKLCD